MYPQKFYGTNIRNIRTEADAISALDSFIKSASDDEVTEACHELESLDEAIRHVINMILWKLEYDFESKEWGRCFSLKYASA